MSDIIKWTAAGLKFWAAFNQIADKKVKVGYNEKSGTYDDETTSVTLAEVATFNEFGTEYAPARPFMRNTIDNRKDKITKVAMQQFKGLVNGDRSAEQVLDSIGICAKKQMQVEIREGMFVPNASSTVAKKHSSKPLIDTGRMRQHVEFEVVGRND